ncbi:TlpA family protein disulfide reductase [Amycolatopsis viridis]|uniref:Thiol-disulfide isomerase/thioredoxin n=1 Tax=Amycolatopsis viridis TaxID=185678 RepID=A0ABX0T0J6_9PSEU|nr:TlpA disulfide reductase family protein [Amycolatopsis viridis]NIH81370.1 thiol-disulfide isomerase/thioredoxin [Amycolatopsis viridis]
MTTRLSGYCYVVDGRCGLDSADDLGAHGVGWGASILFVHWGRLRARGSRPACLLLAAFLTWTLTACSTGSDAVSQGGNFEFVSPGGKTWLSYAPGERKSVGVLSGPSVTDPNSELSTSDYAGRVLVLNVWGSWCPPCRTEAHALRRLVDTTASQGVSLLGINVRDDQDAASDFMAGYSLNYPSIFDETGRILLRLRGIPLSAVPVTLILDKQQRVAAVYLGAVLETDLMPVLQQVLAES